MDERSLEKQSPPDGADFEGAFATSGMHANHTESSARDNAMRRAEGRRKRGIDAALARADELSPGWSTHALHLLAAFAAEQAIPWTCERYREWAHEAGLQVHPEQRAFGAIIRAGLRDGWFVRVGYAPAASSNCAPKPLYLGANRECA
ncbi:hypothetical protein [Luteimonas sp. YGD11-2]|uniref:hypothetical protein n=1 Tax=Luteimonas sp. YGD11-2 TaxID=2508168 RepID=UPI00100AAFCE|nr:hypothetical protein [Luteimonas sp. YGD11-2]